MAIVTVLHITDLHFGVEPQGTATSTALSQRVNTLDQLLRTVAATEDSWRPQIIVVSGDVGWAGRETDYVAARTWLLEMLDRLSLAPADLVLCPGNHDVDRREANVLARPDTPSSADQLLQVETLKLITRPFAGFESLSRALGLEPLAIGETESIVAGTRRHRGLRFVALNTAWFCRDDADRGRLFLGLPQLEVMAANRQLSPIDRYDDDELTIAVLHHPEAWLSDSELSAYGDRPAALYYLADRAHIILSGHTHGGVVDPRRIGSGALLFVGGATYEGARYRNNFSLLQVDTNHRTVQRRAYEFDPREQHWTLHSDRPHSLRKQHRTAPQVSAGLGAGIPAVRERAREHADRYVQTKSRAVARTATLPQLLRRRVGVHDPAERVRRERGELLLGADRQAVPLLEAIASDRPIFLLGDLGSGKSTLVGQLVSDLDADPAGLLALLVPAKHFLTRVSPDNDFLDEVTAYVREHVAPNVTGFDLRDCLRAQQEVTVVLDGFDELGSAAAEALLHASSTAMELHSRLRVIATGRPIELRGLNYGQWQLLEMLPLTREEQLAILVAEANADGISGPAAAADARMRLEVLQQVPDLARVAETPLVLRLLRPQLDAGTPRRTLGDLLFDVLHERLGRWGQREGKEQARAAFAAALPDGAAREVLLGGVANAVYAAPDRSISRHTLSALVEEAVGSAADSARATAEGTEFLRTAFLDGGDDQLTFPSQPLFQCALGLHIARSVRRGELPGVEGTPGSLWREVSFAAAILRQTGAAAEARAYLDPYIQGLFKTSGSDATPAAAAIVAESLDADLARMTLGRFRALGYRPLRFFDDRTGASASHYAWVVKLAGEEGFEWFYDQYLDPRYPQNLLVTDFESQILQNWLVLVQFKPSLEQRRRLSKVSPPHLLARSYSCHALLPTVSLAVPDAFNAQQRARLAVDALSNLRLRDRAEAVLREMSAGGSRSMVVDALEVAIAQSGDRSSGRVPALPLWRELMGDDVPPPMVVRALVVAEARGSGDEIYQGIDEALGGETGLALLRWYAMSGKPISGDAAVVLYRRGERSLALLAPGLLLAASRYPTNEEAERSLNELLEGAGESGLHFLTPEFAPQDRFTGPAPALWRLLLHALLRSTTAQPAVLRYCVRNLGEFTLARNPDIRRMFQRLLGSDPAYRAVLRDAITSLDRDLGLNAASVLLTCDPVGEVRAGERVVRGSVDALGRHEWARFAMRLALGELVLQRLDELIPTLAVVPRTFALEMLHHNGKVLSAERQTLAIDGLLGEGRWLSYGIPGESEERLELRSLLTEEGAFSHLVRIAETEYGEQASRAALTLLNYHRHRLTVEQEARVWVLAFRKTHELPEPSAERDLRSRMEAPDFAAAFAQEAAIYRQHTSMESGSALLARSFTDPSAWRDIVWSALLQQRMGVNSGRVGDYFLRRGLANTQAGKVIGQAARDFLETPEGRVSTRDKEILALLAHEFGKLPDEAIANALTLGGDTTIQAALLARVASPPATFTAHEKGYLLFAPTPIPEAPLDPEQLRDGLRDSDNIPPEALSVLERVILHGSLQGEEIGRLAEHSKLGALAAAALEVSYGRLPPASWMVRSLGVSVQRRNDRVPEVLEVRHALRRMILADRTAKAAYAAALETDLERDVIPEGSYRSSPELLLRELLAATGELSNARWEEFIGHALSGPNVMDLQLLHDVADAIRESSADRREGILRGLRRAGETLLAVESRYFSHQEAVALLFASLGLLALEDSTSTLAERLFVLSLPGLIVADQFRAVQAHTQGGARIPGLEVLAAVAPILDRVPGSRLHRSIEIGLTSDVPQVRACCRLLAALVRLEAPTHTSAV